MLHAHRAGQVLTAPRSTRPLPTLAQRHRAHQSEEEAGWPKRGCGLPKHGMPMLIPTHSIRSRRPSWNACPGERRHQQPEHVTGLHGLQNQHGIDVRHRSTRSFRWQPGSRPECTVRSANRHALPTTMTMSQRLSAGRCRLRARRLSTPADFVRRSQAAHFRVGYDRTGSGYTQWTTTLPHAWVDEKSC